MGTPVPTTETALSWTDEKHLHFLNTMEASFVRSMLQNDNGHGRRRIYHRLLRLDRPLPDTSDSTLDLKKPLPTARKHAPSGNLDFLSRYRLNYAPSAHFSPYCHGSTFFLK
ncbi:hypothetical protein L6164_006098 [Bauhinia variegata]|uniref:Uncharacterized protein n=1 Tax=Bauhinia variegata TaxID=167791 RepID=A0ACB9PTX4_BAUVA|nr:hypothetical protein L6164_006098 [Bauhinia variegata]